jgi:hypothetical protein
MEAWQNRYENPYGYRAMAVEKTSQGMQIILPVAGMARSACAAAAARKAAGHRKLLPKKPQLEPGGLFDQPEPVQRDLFEE